MFANIHTYALAFMYYFETVTVWVPHIGSVTVGIVFQPGTWRDVIVCTGGQWCMVERIHDLRAISDKREMNLFWAGSTIFEPEVSSLRTAEPL